MELELSMIPREKDHGKNRFTLKEDVSKRIQELSKYAFEERNPEDEEVAIPFLITEVTCDNYIKRLVYALTGKTFSVYIATLDKAKGSVTSPKLLGFSEDIQTAGEEVLAEVFNDDDTITTLVLDIVRGGYEWAEIIADEVSKLKSKVEFLAYDDPKIYLVKTDKLHAVVTAYSVEDARELLDAPEGATTDLIGTSDANIPCGSILLMKKVIEPSKVKEEAVPKLTVSVQDSESESERLVRESLLSIKK